MEDKQQAIEDAKVENRVKKIVSSRQQKEYLSMLPEKYQAEVLSFIDRLQKRDSYSKTFSR